MKIEKEDLIAALPKWFQATPIGGFFNLNNVLYKRINTFQFTTANEENENKRQEQIKQEYEKKKNFILKEIHNNEQAYTFGDITDTDYEIKLITLEKDLEKLEIWYKINSSPNCVIEFHPNYLIKKIKNSLVSLDDE